MGHLFADQYSLLHFSVGVVAYFVGIRLSVWTILHIIFEVVENSDVGIQFINEYLHFFWPGGKEKSDTLTNSIGDTLFAILGWLVADHLDKYGKKAGWYNPEIKPHILSDLI